MGIEERSAEERILDSARREFIAKGISGARMQSIADNAGVNKALLHYYFRSKQKLYEALLDQALETVLRAFDANIGALQPDHGIRNLIRMIVTTYVKILSTNPDFAPLLMREIAEGGSNLSPAFSKKLSVLSAVPPRIIGMLQTAQARGEIRRIPPIHIFINIMGMSAAPFLLRPLVEAVHRNIFGTDITFDDEFFQARIDAVTTMACDGLFIKDEKK